MSAAATPASIATGLQAKPVQTCEMDRVRVQLGLVARLDSLRAANRSVHRWFDLHQKLATGEPACNSTSEKAALRTPDALHASLGQRVAYGGSAYG